MIITHGTYTHIRRPAPPLDCTMAPAFGIQQVEITGFADPALFRFFGLPGQLES